MRLFKLTYTKPDNSVITYSGYYKSPLIARMHYARINELNYLQAKEIKIEPLKQIPETQTFLDFLKQPHI